MLLAVSTIVVNIYDLVAENKLYKQTHTGNAPGFKKAIALRVLLLLLALAPAVILGLHIGGIVVLTMVITSTIFAGTARGILGAAVAPHLYNQKRDCWIANGGTDHSRKNKTRFIPVSVSPSHRWRESTHPQSLAQYWHGLHKSVAIDWLAMLAVAQKLAPVGIPYRNGLG